MAGDGLDRRVGEPSLDQELCRKGEPPAPEGPLARHAPQAPRLPPSYAVFRLADLRSFTLRLGSWKEGSNRYSGSVVRTRTPRSLGWR